MVTEHRRHQTYRLIRWAGSLFRIPILTSAHIAKVHGRRRVTSVDVQHANGEVRSIPCDTVVFTGDWIPEHELARLGKIELDRGTLGPCIDQSLATSRPGIFAAGNLLRGAERADIAAMEGQHAARSILAFLREKQAGFARSRSGRTTASMGQPQPGDRRGWCTGHGSFCISDR